MHRPTISQRIFGAIRESFILAVPTAFVLMLLFAVASCVGMQPGQLNTVCPVIDWTSLRDWVIFAAGVGAVIGFLYPKVS